MRFIKIACVAATVMLFGIFPKECGVTPDDIWSGIIQNDKEMDYFLDSERTDEKIMVAKGDINPNFNYKREKFEFDGDTYVAIEPMAEYRDGYRKDAVATITDGEVSLTVYDYGYPSNFHVLNISKFLYVREDELEEITEYYNTVPFTYQFVYYMPDWYGEKLVSEEFEDVEFSDKLFLDLVNGSPDVCTKLSRMKIRETQVLRFTQHTKTTNMERSFEFYRVDGEFYVSNIRNPLPRDGVDISHNDCYHVTDQRLIEMFREKVDEVNEKLLEKNFTRKSY